MRQWAPCGHPASTSVTSGPPPPAVLQSQFLLAFISVHAKLHVTCFLPGAWHEQRMIPGPWASSSLHSGSACATHGSGRASEGRCWAPLPECLGLGCYSHHLRLLSLCSRSDTGPGLQAELEGVVVLAAREQTSPYTSAMAIALEMSGGGAASPLQPRLLPHSDEIPCPASPCRLTSWSPRHQPSNLIGQGLGQGDSWRHPDIV